MIKKIIDIVGIALPALIIFLSILRIFVKKTKGVNGLIIFSAILLLLAGILRPSFHDGGSGSSEPKPPPLTVSKHSEAFNQSLENILTAYYAMTDGFVKNDTATINHSGASLKIALDSFKIDELKADTLIYQTAIEPYANLKSEITSIIADPSMDEKKGSLNIFSDQLFNLVSTARYDLAKLYWMECDKAFGEDKPGNWLSKMERSENPYGQKDCAEKRATIDHVPVDTTKKISIDATKN